jgi:hypothetical protein
LATIPSNQTGEQQATIGGTSIEQNSPLFSPTESLTSNQQQPLTINIAQQTRILFIFIFIRNIFLFVFF